MPPPPPPRISSDPNHPINKKNQGAETTTELQQDVTVTHLSPSLEKETLFPKPDPSNNPFLSSLNTSLPDQTATAASATYANEVEAMIGRSGGGNVDNGGLTNPFKYNTIGRSNPFSSSDAPSTGSTNPFLNDVMNGNSDVVDSNVSAFGIAVFHSLI